MPLETEAAESATRRSDIEAAFDKVAAEPAQETPEPVAAAPEPAADAPATAAPTEKAEDGTRARDERGRFAPAGQKPSQAAAPTEEAVKPAETPPAPVASPETPTETQPKPAPRAPQSWSKPAAREAWASLPADVQAEVTRREREISSALQESSTARKFASQFEEVVRPYEGFIRAAGHSPLESVASLMQTAATLQAGTPHQKAALAAKMVTAYSIPPELVAAYLQGAPPPAPAQHEQPQDIRATIENVIAERLRSVESQRAEKEVASFAEAHEFATDPDIRRKMSALLEGGIASGLEDAYTQAIALTPEIGKILGQREAAKAAATAKATTQSAKTAASSVRPSAAAPDRTAQPNSRRDYIEAAISSLEGR